MQTKPQNAPSSTAPADLSEQTRGAPAQSAPASQPSLGLQDPLLLAPPTPSLTNAAADPFSAPASGLSAPTAPSPSLDHGLESKLLKSTPFSVIVLT
eukprot:163854-Pelagomonas_calceolata.AAC.1